MCYNERFHSITSCCDGLTNAAVDEFAFKAPHDQMLKSSQEYGEYNYMLLFQLEISVHLKQIVVEVFTVCKIFRFSNAHAINFKYLNTHQDKNECRESFETILS